MPTPPRAVLVHQPKLLYGAGRPEALAANAMAMGLLALADLLDREGWSVEVIHVGVELCRDPCFELVDALLERPPLLIGLSLHWHFQLADVLTQLQALRAALPGATLIVGGQTATSFPDELLAVCPALDAVVRGDGEAPLRALARCLSEGQSWESVPNLSWRRGAEIVHNTGRVVLDHAGMADLCFTRRDLLRHAEDYDGDPHVWLDGPRRRGGGPFHLCLGRGCRWSCAYCAGARATHAALFGRAQPLLRRVEDVVASVAQLAAQGVDTLYICYDPGGAEADAWFLCWFEALRAAGLRPGLGFECFRPPSEAFVAAFARSFDLERSTLVLTPGGADDAIRQRFTHQRSSQASWEQALSVMQAHGVASHLCFSPMPGEGWAEARASASWMQSLRQRFGCSLFVSPVELEPGAPWHDDPARYGLIAPRMGFDALLERHQTLGYETRWAEEVGYATQDLGARVLLLRSVADDAERWVRRALTGQVPQGAPRLISGSVERLDLALAQAPVGRGRAVLVLRGELDEAELIAIARRVAAEAPRVQRLFLHGVAPGPWAGAELRVQPWPANAPKALASLRRPPQVAAWWRAGRPEVIDSCRYGRRLCPAHTGACVPTEAALHPCAGRGSYAVHDRGCAGCEAQDRCARCADPSPLSVAQYCRLMRSTANR